MDFRWYENLEWWNKIARVNVVLFVCSVNVSRSPVAEYYFKKLTSWWGGVEAESGGLYVDGELEKVR